MRIEIPELAVVAMVGVSSSGKSTFAKTHFKKTEILSADYLRGVISDDENNKNINKETFETLYYIANKRLDLAKLTVIDATNVQKEAREKIIKLAREQHCQAVAIVLNIPEKLCQERNKKRLDRQFDEYVIRQQNRNLKRSIKNLKKEGFRFVYVLNSEEDINNAEIVRAPLWNNKKYEEGPFDIIGDIHGCYDELCELLNKLGYKIDKENHISAYSENRKIIFLGDLCDRGKYNLDVLKLVMNMVSNKQAFCVLGNHDAKLLKYLRGKKISLSHGIENTIKEIENESDDLKIKIEKFLDSLVSHYVLDNGKLVVSHAGLKEKYQGRASGRVKEFCIYGETTGENDEYGFPVRLDWANEYRGKALVVYGHTPNENIQIMNNTYCIDTGCVFGGKLTAFKYPEKEIVQVSAKEKYYDFIKPLTEKTKEYDDMLNIEDVTGKRYINTKFNSSVRIKEENSIAALEVMSRFSADPHWLIYLPPTMSPCETSDKENYLEYPIEAFEYYKSRGIDKIICEQKHMGSRAVIVLCKDYQTAQTRFRVKDGKYGIIYTRTGRHFFEDETTEKIIIERLNKVLDKTNFWNNYQTDWVCLDVELMPWSSKALRLIKEQYAGVGRAGRIGLEKAINSIEAGFKIQNNIDKSDNSVDLNKLLNDFGQRHDNLNLYVDAYRQYCWSVNCIDDYKIAPFHILATENKVWDNENHAVHMETIKKYMTNVDPIFIATPYMEIDLNNENSIADGVRWWEELTLSGGEGMVVKPFNFISYYKDTLLQPAVKCRGREYLRIIYGPEYTLEKNITRLKKRSLSKKRNLALNEFSLGMESLKRFVDNEPLYRVHECVFGVLSLESEPVDPRL